MKNNILSLVFFLFNINILGSENLIQDNNNNNNQVNVQDINEQDGEGNTQLNLAVISGNKDLARRLLISKANPNIQNNKGCTSLHLAERINDAYMVILLSTYGASDSIKDNNGYTPIDLLVNELDG